jgi:very-short-patch-repair endonuclease
MITIETQTDENGVVWFKANDVLLCLMYKQSAWRSTIKDHLNKADKTQRVDSSSGQRRKVNFINRDGVVSLVMNSSTMISQEKKLSLLKSLNIDVTNLVFEKKRRFEHHCFENMVKVMFDGYKILPQFTVGDYRLDFYIPDLKIAIEIDEQHHERQQEEDKERQKFIEKCLGCKFLRIKERMVTDIMGHNQ